MTKNYLTDEISRRIAGAFGPEGVEWLNQLPHILENAANRWSIRLLAPFQPLSFHYVAPAIGMNGEPVVLKAGVPNQEFSNEIDALRHFDGQGMVRLLKADYDAGLMLLERIEPGVSLHATLDDENATSILAEVMRCMRKSKSDKYSFPSVTDWAKGFQRLRDHFDGKTGPFPKAVVDRASELMFELIGSMSDPIVLHGDLHHWNILSAEREPWLALDPKGVIGEHEYEVGAWFRNPFPQVLGVSNPKKVMTRRVDQLTEELGFDRDRIIGWAYSQAVLSGIWFLEDGSDDWRGELACADHIAPLLSTAFK
jgi:streptomycin 6-kinase